MRLIEQLHLVLSQRLKDPVSTWNANGLVYSASLRNVYINNAVKRFLRRVWSLSLEHAYRVAPAYVKRVSMQVNEVDGFGFGVIALTERFVKIFSVRNGKGYNYQQSVFDVFYEGRSKFVYTIANNLILVYPADVNDTIDIIYVADYQDIDLNDALKDVEIQNVYADMIITLAMSFAYQDIGDERYQIYEKIFENDFAVFLLGEKKQE
jgi:uncharacterized membrane protein